VTTTYTYDAVGNRLSMQVGATTYTNTIDANSNRITAVQDPSGNFTPSYDAAGNITGDGVNTYAYRDRGRMQTATSAAGTVSYLYNAAGLRVGKTGPAARVPTGAAYYVHDDEGKLLGEYDATGAAINETLYFGTLGVIVLKTTGTAAGNNRRSATVATRNGHRNACFSLNAS
jgi:YD repeat-containing protein